MEKPIITINKINKKYRIGVKRESYNTLRESIMEFIKTPLNNFKRLRNLSRFDESTSSDRSEDVLYALSDVSFDVKQGEVMGIIGRNGSGKSTLLKILSRITDPTSGEAVINGRVASLLEVGTGFHPELTGRENIYLNGTILGMRKSEIDSKFDKIVEFSEIEKFLDTPVKRYSSGMYVKLAFSVAAHLEPDVLIIDEVLAVGDMKFQKKCLSKMGEVASDGRTVIFVSHNMSLVRSLCDRCVLLEDGKVVKYGDTNEVIDYYYSGEVAGGFEADFTGAKKVPGDETVKLLRAKVVDSEGKVCGDFMTSDVITIEMEYDVLKDGAYLTPSIGVYNSEGICVFNSLDVAYDPMAEKKAKKGSYRSTCTIPADFFNNEVYFIGIQVMSKDTKAFHIYQKNLLVIHVEDKMENASTRGWYSGGFHGVIRPVLNWNCKQL